MDAVIEQEILIVDDEEIVHQSIKKSLRGENFAFHDAFSADEGLEIINNLYHPIVLLDIVMPGTDGMELLEKLHQTRPDAKVIMITGYATMLLAIKSLKKGAVDFIAKPFTRDEMRRAVDKAVQDTKNELSSGRDFGIPQAEDLRPGTSYRLGAHSWALIEDGGAVRIGCFGPTKDHAGIIKVTLQLSGEKIEQGKSCATVTYEDASVEVIYAPVSGKIIEINQDLKDNPGLLASDPSGTGWLYVITPTAIEFELDFLAKEFQA